jgi:uncharacterized protein (TIGR00288 family)
LIGMNTQLPSSTGDVALFIDHDNLQINLETRFGRSANKLAYDLDRIRQKLAPLGRIAIARAYADWSFCREQADTLLKDGCETVLVRRPGTWKKLRENTRKNAADIQMAIDIVETSQQCQQIETFVLVTGDFDFLPVVQYLRRHGKRVAIIGLSGSYSEALGPAADCSLMYDHDIEELAPVVAPRTTAASLSPTEPDSSGASGSDVEVNAARELLWQAALRIVRDSVATAPDCLPGAALGNLLQAQLPNEYEIVVTRSYSLQTLLTTAVFEREYPFIVTRNENDICVRLKPA